MIQNKYSYLFSFAAVIGMLLFSSCDDNGTGTDEPESEIETQTVADLHAPDEEGTFTFFNLETGLEVSSADSASSNWDVGFSGTSVITNSGTSGPGQGGAVILDIALDQVTIAPAEGYVVDSAESFAIPTGGGNGWYNYTGMTPPQHAILPIPDKTIVVKTADGNHYAKMEMISYYQGNPDTSTEDFADYTARESSSPSQYYTFRYAIQLTEGLRELQ